MARYLYDRHNYTSTTTYEWRKYTVKKVTYYNEGQWNDEVVVQSSPAPDFSKRGSAYVTFRSDIGKYSLSAQQRIIENPPTISSDYRTAYVYEGRGNLIDDPTYGHVYTQYIRFSFLRKDNYYFDFRSQMIKSASGPFQGDARDSFVDTVTGQSYSYKLHNQVNADGFWWMRGAAQTTNVKGAYIDTIEAEFGTYPADGVSGDFWYVLSKRAFPELQIRQSNQLKTSADGWVRIGGQLKQIQQIWVRVNGQLKEV